MINLADIQGWILHDTGEGAASGLSSVFTILPPAGIRSLKEVLVKKSALVLWPMGSLLPTTSFWEVRMTRICGSKRQLWLSRLTSPFSVFAKSGWIFGFAPPGFIERN